MLCDCIADRCRRRFIRLFGGRLLIYGVKINILKGDITMSQNKSRRELALLATGGVIATGLIVAGAKTALAEPQPAMERARAALTDALASLNQAADDKGGHKAKAIRLVESALHEVNAGIVFANRH
jgi:hypothetical protein